jgi:hypothetical protein
MIAAPPIRFQKCGPVSTSAVKVGGSIGVRIPRAWGNQGRKYKKTSSQSRMTHEHSLPHDPHSSARTRTAPRHYRLRCSVCSAAFDDDGFVLQCPVEHARGLLVTDYSAKQCDPEEHDDSIYRHWRWLPIVRRLSGAGRTITYRSAQLSALTGLPKYA